MGNFKPNNRSRFRDRSEDRNFSKRSRDRDDEREDRPQRREFGRNRRNNRSSPEMHDVTCTKCGKRCQVPFKPTGSKPVLCSECFKSDSPRNQSPISSEQIKQINLKLDKILNVLKDLEIAEDDSDEEDSEDEI